MTLAVSLPMYIAAPDALLAFWTGLRGHLREAGLDEVPEALSHPADLHAHWVSPGVLLSQTCGYPLATALAGRIQLVGTPRYTAPGCQGSDYASLIVVRQGDPANAVAELRGRRAAINSRDSQSGHNAFRALVAPYAHDGRFFAEVIESGGHAASLHLIQDEKADVASIDCVTYAMVAQATPKAVDGLRVLGLTEACPGLPLITSAATEVADIARLRSAFAAACNDPALASACRVLMLDGIDARPLADYNRCLDMEARAKQLGYPVLA